MNEIGKAYVDFMRGNLEQMRNKINDELYTLSLFEVTLLSPLIYALFTMSSVLSLFTYMLYPRSLLLCFFLIHFLSALSLLLPLFFPYSLLCLNHIRELQLFSILLTIVCFCVFVTLTVPISFLGCRYSLF